MNAAAHIVSEVAARLGDRILDERAIAVAVDLARADYHAAPCTWAMVERTLLSMRRRRVAGHLARLLAATDPDTLDAALLCIAQRRRSLRVVARADA